MAVFVNFRKNRGSFDANSHFPKWQRNNIPALPFSRWVKTVARLKGKNYPANPQTIGKHMLKRRIDLNLLQKDVANFIGVSEDCITYWENERSVPQVQYAPAIIHFLGFNPYHIAGNNVGVKIKNYRIANGLSHKKMGKLVGVDASTISCWESGEFLPKRGNWRKLYQVIKN